MIENRINKIMSLSNGDKYMILKQAIYEGDNYYMACLLDDKGNLTDTFKALHEYKDGDKLRIELIKDSKLLKFIIEHLEASGIGKE